MKSSEIYTRLLAGIEKLPQETRDNIRSDIAMVKKYGVSSFSHPLAALVESLRADMMKESAKASGNAAKLSALKRLVKRGTNVQEFTKAPKMIDGKMTYCDGSMLIYLAEALPVDCLSEDVNVPDYNKLFESGTKNATEKFALPSVAEIKAFIAEWKAEFPKEEPIYCISATKSYVKADYLLDTLTLIPANTGKTAFMHAEAEINYNPIIIESGENKAMICTYNAGKKIVDYWKKRA